MRDDLIGFVLGALDASEEDQIRHKLEHDRDCGRQFELVRQSLVLLRLAKQDEDPPEELTQRTMQRLDSYLARDGVASVNDLEELDNNAVPDHSLAEWPTNAANELVAPDRRWMMADFVVAAGVCLAAACLFFPALANSRWHSQLRGCQNNMRDVGTALIDYSGTEGGYFPRIPVSGKLSVAGIYAPKLVEKGLVNDVRVFRCPAKGNTVVLKIPQMKDIVAARGPRLVTLHRTMGGDYAYPLGFVQKGKLQGIRNQGRTHAALLADAPLENLRNLAIGTHGRGQNILFEDGHVKFLTTRVRPGSESDDLFFNDEGVLSAGLHEYDSVLASSPVSPLSTGGERVLSKDAESP